jgi:hypothetical protein
MAPREGFEPPTTGLEGRCSIHLSYRGGAAAVRADGHDTPQRRRNGRRRTWLNIARLRQSARERPGVTRECVIRDVTHWESNRFLL